MCVLWGRPISSGPVFVVVGGAMDPILCLLPLTFLKRRLQSGKPLFSRQVSGP